MATACTSAAEGVVDRPTSFPVVAIASSAGGLTALAAVLSALPARFPAAVLIVQHLDPNHKSYLADIMSKRTALHVRQAGEHDLIEPGLVLIAPPDRHLMVSPEHRVHLSNAKLVHFVRPSADLLFESAAATFGNKVIGLVLTGSGTDASLGVTAIKRMGGTVIAQDEASSEFFGMPGAAIETGAVDYVLPLQDIPARLLELVGCADD